MIDSKCPLPADWPTQLDKVFGKAKFASHEEEDRLRKAHLTPLGTKLLDIDPDWDIAPDDRRGLPALSGTHFLEGFPRHVHTTFELVELIIHIDHIWGQLYSPGRGTSQIHVFINGQLAGFGHTFGTSLGLSASIKPAVALLPQGNALVVRRPTSHEREGFAQEGLPLYVELIEVADDSAATPNRP